MPARWAWIYNSPTRISKTFGKLPTSEKYGIFLNVDCKAQKGDSDHETLFYHLSSGIVRDGKNLFTEIDGKKVMLAKKKWYGWVTVDGVKIQHSMERTPYPTFKVWVEVE